MTPRTAFVSIAAIIPARLASVRFPGKVLEPIHGLPMIEHIRRRALLCEDLSYVAVATADEEVAKVVRSAGGTVIMTSTAHLNGTDRVAEAAQQVACTHVVVLQGDEPLILPSDLTLMASAMRAEPEVPAWNATGALVDAAALDDRSTVKAILSRTGRILLCTRRSVSHGEASSQMTFTRKVLGLIGFERNFLALYRTLPTTPLESADSIEQSRIIEHDWVLRSVELPNEHASVNHRSDLAAVQRALSEDALQRSILERITRQTVG